MGSKLWGVMECPNCGVINPATAEQCECGYSFKAQEIGGVMVDRTTKTLVPNALTNNRMALVGFCLGLASILLFDLGLVPLAAIVCSAIGLGTFKADTQKHRWMAGVGLALGILFMLVNAEMNGHIAFP